MAAPITGQLAISATAAAIDPTGLSRTNPEIAAFTLKAPVTNTNTVYIGAAGVTTTTGYPLTPGDEFEYQRQGGLNPPALQCTPADFYAVGTAGSDVLAWFATP